MEVCSTGLRVSSSEFLFNIHKSFYFGKVATFENVFISYLITDGPTTEYARTWVVEVRAKGTKSNPNDFILPLKGNRNFVSRVLYEAICPLRTAHSCLCLSAKRLFQRLTTVTYFV